MDVNDAYRIVTAGHALRLAEGEKPIGFKMGLTSKAKREQVKVFSAIWGYLTDRMHVADGGELSTARSIHPRIEPEIVFVMGQPLSGTVTREQALAAIAEVRTGMEIIDSRYVGFKDFSLPDVVADNSSASHFVMSKESRPPADLPLDQIPMRMFVDGRVAHEAPSSEISGHPVDSLVQLCAMLAPMGLGLTPGQIVLAGAATPAIALEPGREYRLDADGLPSASIRAV
jgi:2-oxo-3-hexenedioate decarboxylase